MLSDFQKVKKIFTQEKEQKPPPPFDIRDIPVAMKAMNFSLGTKFSSRWLDGRAYIKPENGIFDADMVDTTSVTLDWLFKRKDIKANYDSFVKKLCIIHRLI